MNTYVHHILVRSAEVKDTACESESEVIMQANIFKIKIKVMMIIVFTYWMCYIRADAFPC